MRVDDTKTAECNKRSLQEEKSHMMRLRLIEATLDCIRDYGYHGTSLSKILKRAGVSRGAWRHHYNNKKDLIAAAAEHFLAGPVTRAGQLAAEIEPENRTLEFFSDYIWENFYQGPYRDIWLEFHIACRTDAELRDRLVPIIRKFFTSLDALWHTHFQTTRETSAPVDMLMNLTLFILRGMAIQSIIIDDPVFYKKLRDQWVQMLTPLVSIEIA